MTTGDDGKTFYGNVFGGGSGYYPYTSGKWLEKAGWVEGNTLVEIKGGHILTNAYGGNEMTNVGNGLTAGKGKCEIQMTGGTIGVPRTLAQIKAHPVTGYLFGAGKGDQRTLFNTSTNVKETVVSVTGGTIYGSVLGGGEDGHVLGDVKMTIGQASGKTTKIGTFGTSSYDGNVFGGGRGFKGDALTAGNVGGSVDLDITGGTILGSVYGGGRMASVGYGLYAVGDSNYGKMRDDDKDDAGTATTYFETTGLNKMGRGHIDVSISGGTIGNDNEYDYIAPGVTGSDLTAAKAKMPDTEHGSNNRLKHTIGGNVYGGGMGRHTALDGSVPSHWTELGNAKSTKLTITGGTIKSNVYGGGELGAVKGYHTTGGKNYGTEISIASGAVIGTEIDDESDVTRYTFGSVYGGGYGTEAEVPDISDISPSNATSKKMEVENLGAFVASDTYINMTGGHVRASVYGGGDLAAVGGSSNVNISGGEIGKGNEVYGADYSKPYYVKYGGATMGNVYGGGNGSKRHPIVGAVQTNTNVNISASDGVPEGQPFIYHNVYGGGALASVGKFHPCGSETSDSDPTNPYAPVNFIPLGVPYGWTHPDGTVSDVDGIARVTITGGTIGISGHDNGMVNGSSRGDVDNLASAYVGGVLTQKDPYDRLAWVNKTYVTIGTSGSSTGPRIKGSVYGGGENGHNNNNATVNIYSGTIGILESELYGEVFLENRGNVYGAGCGTDTYTGADGKQHYNAWSGAVCGSTTVNISGGHVVHNVYGGGSMGSVGTLFNDYTLPAFRHTDPKSGFALSWPYVFTYKPTSGSTTISITGGRIGTTGKDNGDVYGGARGKAGETLEMAHLGSVRTTSVTVEYPTTADPATFKDDNSVPCIAGSLYGGGEDGIVYENTSVTLTKGLVGHAIYGGGKGKGTFQQKLVKFGSVKDPVTGEYSDADKYDADAYSLTAGKVFGNTSVSMTGGYVVRNIYGGGNMASVGKGNYAGGSDDFYPAGYGETLNGNTTAADKTLWDSGNANSTAFLGSGITTVSVTGGTVGTANGEKDDLPTGNIYGGCRGEAAAEIMDVEINPTFFMGYVNETNVTIGTNGQASTGAGEVGNAPRIYGSVYGGGQDGHVRRETKVTVYSGEIGNAYTSANQTLVGTSDRDNLQWLHRGNVYGGGSGIGLYEFDYDRLGTYTDANGNGKYDEGETVGTYTYSYGGQSVTVKDIDHSSSAGSVNNSSTVDIKGGIIHRNVYGGGSLASVAPPTAYEGNCPASTGTKGMVSVNTVNISGTIGTQTDYDQTYGGEVYGGSRGGKNLDPAMFAVSIWTKVNIKMGAHVMGNVFGGGDAGKVLKDTKVVVGDQQ